MRFVSPPALRPAFLAEPALLRLAAGAVGDPAPLQPLYLRRPPAAHLTGPPVAPPSLPSRPYYVSGVTRPDACPTALSR